jgi:glutaminyl-peptide cyclotransferase
MADEPTPPEEDDAPDAPEAPDEAAAPAAAPPPPDDDGGGRLSVKVLVVALVLQLILFGGLIALTVHGFPFIGGGGDDQADGNGYPTTFPAGRVPKSHGARFDAPAALAIAKQQVDVGQRARRSCARRPRSCVPSCPTGASRPFPRTPACATSSATCPAPAR